MSVVTLVPQDAGGARLRVGRRHPDALALAQREPTGPLPSSRVKLPGLTKDGSIPGLDVAALQKRYTIDPQTVRRLTGTFIVPVDVTADQLLAIKRNATGDFIRHMTAQGWYFRPERRIQIKPGRYPAPDLKTGLMRPDAREYLVHACFTRREQNMVRIPLDPKLLEPTPTTSKVDQYNVAPGITAS